MKEAVHIDLHMHSTASDGSYTPSELARACKELGLEYAALTDHDTIDGVAEFLDEARRVGLRAISGLEFNVDYEGEMHILAYGVDIHYAPLVEELEVLANQRRNRAANMVKKLISQGFAITMERVNEIAAGGVVGRPHIARALFESGYGEDLEDAFKTYLEPGGAGYLPRLKIASERAIRLTKEAGGKAVLAHPKLTEYGDFDELLQKLKVKGLEGIEAYYPAHSDRETAYFEKLADRYGLFVTCGSDFHGATRKSTALGREQRAGLRVRRDVAALFRACGAE